MPLVALVGLTVLVAAFATLGTVAVSRALGESFAAWLRDAGIVVRILGGIGGSLAVRLTRKITHYLGQQWDDLEHLASSWVSGLYQYFDLAITNALEWPLWVWKLQRWLLFVELPRILRQAWHGVGQTVHTIVREVPIITKQIVRLPKLSKAAAKALVAAAVATYVHPFLADLQWLRRHFQALTAVLPRALPLPNIPAIPNLRKRVKKLEKLLAAGLGIAVVLRALGRLRLGWIRCNNWRTAGRAVCGFDPRMLESLLADGLTIFSVLSVVEFANELRAIEDEALGILGKLVREWPA